MLGKTNLKKLFHEVIAANPQFKKIDSIDTLIVKTYHHLTDAYGEHYTMDDAKEIALCIYYDYGFLHNSQA